MFIPRAVIPSAAKHKVKPISVHCVEITIANAPSLCKLPLINERSLIPNSGYIYKDQKICKPNVTQSSSRVGNWCRYTGVTDKWLRFDNIF